MPKALITLLFAVLLSQSTLSGSCLAADEESAMSGPALQTALVDASAASCLEALARQDARLQTIQQDLHRLNRDMRLLQRDLSGPGLTEIIGGFGYIIGLFGLIAWFRCKCPPR